MRTLILGAGKTGRGFIGRLCEQDRVPVLFADADERLIKSLSTAREYRVAFFSSRSPVRCVSFEATNAFPESLLPWWPKIDVVFVSVGVNNLALVGELLSEVSLRTQDTRVRTVILCENAIDPCSMLMGNVDEKTILRERFNYCRGAVFCTSINDPVFPIQLVSEDYNKIECEKLPVGLDMAAYPFLEPTDDFDVLIRRKLYTYNAATAILGFLGWLKGHEYLHEAAADPEISLICKRFYGAVNRAISQKFGVALAEQQLFASRSWNKFTNEAIADPIMRNVRNPISKLTPDERLIAPLRLIDQAGLDSGPVVVAIAVAALYAMKPNRKWTSGTKAEAKTLLKNVSGLSPDDPCMERIEKTMERIVEGNSRLTQLL